MGNKWKDTGHRDLFGLLTFGLLGVEATVQNTETGEYKTVYVAPGQKVGEAIERGQFTDKPTSEWGKNKDC